ncbi:hypothetical protein QJQ45_008357 [Haematococcus lacustris]|nr:hypothetical protein QJQ45_008357 [Haematococcus lacustris]
MQHQCREAHMVPYSRKMGRAPPSPWPVLHDVPGAASGRIRMQHSVLRFPEGVSAQLGDGALTLSGQAGSIQLSLQQLDPTGLVASQLVSVPATTPGQAPRPLLLLASPDKAAAASVTAQLESAIQGVLQGYILGITVKGVGYRMEPVDTPVAKQRCHYELDSSANTPPTYPHPQPTAALRLRVGLPKPMIYPLPPDVRAFCVKPTLAYLYGLQLERLQQLAMSIRAVRKPSVYTGNGIQLVGEVVRSKQRSSRKAK